MPEQTILISEEEQTQRNRLLRRKKCGMQLALVITGIAASSLIYLLQKQETISQILLVYLVVGMTVLLCLTTAMYMRFAFKITKDMQSNEKIVTTGILIRVLLDQRTRRQSITLDVNGRWLTLTMEQLRRLVPNVIQTQRLLLHDRFELEFTPYGRHLMRATRL